MAIYKEDIADINLETGNIHRSFLRHSIGTQDQHADHFGIRVMRDGEPVDLTGISVQGVFMPPQGSPIAITGDTYTVVEGNVAKVILPQACYNYEGSFTLAIKLIDITDSITGTIRIIDGVVDNTHASGTVAPTGSVPTYQEILSVYADMVDALADVASYAANFAPEFVQGTANAAGSFVMNDGVLYLLPDGHTAGTTWANTTKTQANVGGQLSDLKSAFVPINKSLLAGESFVELPFSLTSGYYVRYANGVLASSDSSSATDYINISSFEYIFYKRRTSTSSNSAAGIAFYDKNKTYISGEQGLSGQTTLKYVDKLIYIPNNAVYVRCSTFTDTATYGEFKIEGFSRIGRNVDAGVNGVKNANGVLFNAITAISYERGGLGYSDGQEISPTTYPNYVRTANMIPVHAGSTVDVDAGYKYVLAMFTLGDTPTYITGKSASQRIKFVVPFDCNIRIAISDINDSPQTTTAISEHFILNLYGFDNKLDLEYAKADDFMDATSYQIDLSNIGISYGGLDSNGKQNSRTNRLRYKFGTKGATSVKKGSVITPNEGYKFAVALYSSYTNNSDFVLEEYVNIRTTAYTVPYDCFIRIMFATNNDDTLWTKTDEGQITLTEEGTAAAEGALTLNLIGGTIKEEVQKLEDRTNNSIWDAPNRLETEIPLNALAFHELFDGLVTDGKLTRTILGYANNDSDYPIYLYTLRNDMNHLSSSYKIVQWNGHNELYQRPKIWLDSGIHGNERTTPYALYDFINKLCTKTEYQQMRNAFDWYFVPLVNPWGFSNSAIKTSTGVLDNGSTYTSSNKSQYTIVANTSETHQGIRRNLDGIDINRDFGNFVTEEAQMIRDLLDSLTEDGRNFIFAMDSHQSSTGDDVNIIGAFLSLNYTADATAKAFMWSKWMQAGAKTEMIIGNDLDRDVVQSVYSWDGTNASTARNYMANYADYSMCFEGGQTCLYYSQSTAWSNPVARTFTNTQYQGFLYLLTKHWMN